MAVGVSQGRVGNRLARARRARGVDIREVAAATRIHPHYLEALERDAPPEDFPAPVYARAFLREYAKQLGLDPEPLVEAYRSAHQDPEAGPMVLPAPIERSHGPRVATAMAAASVAVLLAIMVFAGREPSKPSVIVPLPSVPQASPPPTVEPGRTTAPARPRAVVLSVRVVERASWVRVVRGGAVGFEGTLAAGTSRTFRHRGRIDVVVGDAGAVRLSVSGKRLGAPGRDGEVYRAGFVLRKGRIRVVPTS